MIQQIRENYSQLTNSLTTSQKRLLLTSILFIDSLILGLTYGNGILNLLDILLLDKLPTDLIWLMQIVESISAGFIVVKMFFDDIPKSNLRTLLILLSPLFLVFVVFVTLEALLQGLETRATITLDLISISTGTLTWASTYLAIAIGLTLTYKVQRYGNFAQSEFFMIGMYLAMILVWSDYFVPMYDAPRDGVLTWSVLCWTLLAAFILTGIAGIIIDRLVYRGFREESASPQVMMIASLGVALILRAITYLRFGSSRNMFEPDSDWRMPTMRWELPTTKFRFNLGERELIPAEPFWDSNGNGIYDRGNNGLLESFIDLDGDNRWDAGQTYNHYNCEQTGVDEVTGEPILSRIVSEDSRPFFELYDTNIDCITQATTNYAYYKGIVPVVIFSSVAILLLLLTKTRLGRKMRAVADNPELAASSGINVEQIQLTSAFLSAGISGIGGAIFAMTLRYNPETAFTLLLPSFAVIVLGTIGSIPGAIVASLIVGFVRALSSPILIGIGSPLGRSNYTALDGVMPYIFLVAVLMIMPEGIGDAYEKWKVDRLRAKRSREEERKLSGESEQPSRIITFMLAIFPLTALLGLHNWWNNRTDRAQTLGFLTVGGYSIHRLLQFVKTNSFTSGTCSESCISDTTVETNYGIIAGSDGILQPEDSPFFSDSVSEIDSTWFDLMQTEIWFVDMLASFDSLFWPLFPILLYTFALFECQEYLYGTSTSNRNKIETKSIIAPLREFLIYSVTQIKNVYRILIEMLAVTLSKNARARAVQLPAWNEALGLPRPWDQQWSLRMQQIMAYETDLLEFEDIFDENPAIDSKVTQLKDRARLELQQIDNLGGALNAIEFMKTQLVRSNSERISKIENGSSTVVGVNKFIEGAKSPLTANDGSIMLVDADAERDQLIRLEKWRENRNSDHVKEALHTLKLAAKSGENIMPPSIKAAKAGVTTGEWGMVMRDVFGIYKAPTGVGKSISNDTSDLDHIRLAVDRVSNKLGRRLKLLVGKPGLDGHLSLIHI